MSKWEVKEIKQLGRVVTGKTPPKDEGKYFEGEFLFVSPKDLDFDKLYVFETETSITKEALDKFKNQVISRNAVMYTSLSFSFGKIGIASEAVLTNQQISSIVVNSSHDYRFVYYLLRANRPLIFSYNSGIDTPIVPKSVFEKIEFRIPPLPIQKKIASVLSAYDDLIENNDRRIALLEKMTEEIYREWFVRLRFPGHKQVNFHKGIPEGWEVRKIRELVKYYIGGGWGNETSSAEFGVGAFVIRGTDLPSINNGNYPNEIFRFHKNSNYQSRKLETGDIIFEVSGGSKDQLLGRSSLITEKILNFYNHNVICASFCKLIRINKNLASPYFMKYFLKLYYTSELVSIYQVQSTGISNYQFESFLSYQTIITPPVELIHEFDKHISPMMNQKDLLGLSNLSLKQTRDRLLTRLISGKLSVEDLDIQFPPSMTAETTPTK